MIRKAEIRDVSRIAEILVFVKRIKFRPIFRNDDYSFGGATGPAGGREVFPALPS